MKNIKTSGVAYEKKRHTSLSQPKRHHQSHSSLNSINIDNNSAPINRRLREARFKNNSTNSISASPQQNQAETRTSAREDDLEIRGLITTRSKRLTICLICLLASISCLSPFVSLHLTQRVGLLLFESDLVQFRSSLFSVILCLIVLVGLHSIILLFLNDHDESKQQIAHPRNSIRKSWIMQRTFKQLISLFASISAIAYLALVLLVPQIRQIQRMPLATFDCNANLITIENCHQQFSVKGGELSVGRAFKQLLANDLSSLGGTNERLLRKLNCLNYNDKELKALQVPTRFLLHKCGLVCKPQRQQLHQFSDDLNKEQLYGHQHSTSAQKTDQTSNSEVDNKNQQPNKLLVPPYNTEFNPSELADNNNRHFIYHNSTISSSIDTNQDVNTSNVPTTEDSTSSTSQQVSLRVCFSGEFSGGSNYKQFCVTNLAFHRHRSQEQTLTVGQLNAMLRRFIPESPTNNNQDLQDPLFNDGAGGLNSNHHRTRKHQMNDKDDQNTHYINPVVQFESHFKNWPHMPLDLEGNEDSFGEESWCKFRPIPPFIVNNKPFSDIQCSLEHEYTMTTSPNPLLESSTGGAERIYLKKSQTTTGESRDSSSFTNERCNIQCKVNILYQLHMNDKNKKHSQKEKARENYIDEDVDRVNLDDNSSAGLHYYLPLKPCVLLTGDGDKSKTLNYYLIFRSIGDGTLILVFILVDLFLLLESIDTRQFQLEAKKVRLIAPLAAIALIPLIVALLFDLIPYWYPYYYATSSNQKGRKEGYLVSFLNEKIIPSLIDFFATTSSTSATVIKKKLTNSTTTTNPFPGLAENPFDMRLSSTTNSLIIDNFVLPFFFYSIFMFILAINSLTIPMISSSAPLMRSSSTEELGISLTKKSTSSTSNAKNNRQKVELVEKKQELDEQFKRRKEKKLLKRLLIKLISLHLIALFMGTQFNLSQITQTQILIETFGDPGSTNGSSYSALWFILITHSIAIIFILLLTILFIDEISTFLSNFSPFKSTVTGVFTSTSEQNSRKKAKFLQYLTFSLFIYSARCFAISNLISESRFKWLVVFLFQVTEFFNFPLTWYALTDWGHTIITEHRVKSSFIKEKLQQLRKQTNPEADSEAVMEEPRDFKQPPASGSRALDFHLIIQSSLALAYFAIARSIALLFHSVNASLHLHSDNVDWFITSFYKNLSPPSTTSSDRQNVNRTMANLNATANSGSTANGSTVSPPESLFSPLPGERQTYLYASRLFLKYNSLICLIVGVVLLITLLYVKYQIWAENKRSFDIFDRGSHSNLDENAEHIDDQISLDLKRLHQQINPTNTKTIYPESEARRSSDNLNNSVSDLDRRVDSPSAKILFHYNLDRLRNSSDSSSTETEPRKSDNFKLERQQRFPRPKVTNHRQYQEDLSTPIAMEELAQDEDLRTEEEEYFSEREVTNREDGDDQYTKRTVRSKSKKVRIFEEPQDNGAVSFNEPEFGVSLNDIMVPEQFSQVEPERIKQSTITSNYLQRKLIRSKEEKSMREEKMEPIRERLSGNSSNNDQPQKKRSISFAPITTFIGADGFSEQHRSMTSQNHRLSQREEDSRTNSATSSSTIRRASPDPSIGDFEDNENGSDSIE